MVVHFTQDRIGSVGDAQTQKLKLTPKSCVIPTSQYEDPADSISFPQYGEDPRF